MFLYLCLFLCPRVLGHKAISQSLCAPHHLLCVLIVALQLTLLCCLLSRPLFGVHVFYKYLASFDYLRIGPLLFCGCATIRARYFIKGSIQHYISRMIERFCNIGILLMLKSFAWLMPLVPEPHWSRTFLHPKECTRMNMHRQKHTCVTRSRIAHPRNNSGVNDLQSPDGFHTHVRQQRRLQLYTANSQRDRKRQRWWEGAVARKGADELKDVTGRIGDQKGYHTRAYTAMIKAR